MDPIAPSLPTATGTPGPRLEDGQSFALFTPEQREQIKLLNAFHRSSGTYPSATVNYKGVAYEVTTSSYRASGNLVDVKISDTRVPPTGEQIRDVGWISQFDGSLDGDAPPGVYTFAPLSTADAAAIFSLALPKLVGGASVDKSGNKPHPVTSPEVCAKALSALSRQCVAR